MRDPDFDIEECCPRSYREAKTARLLGMSLVVFGALFAGYLVLAGSVFFAQVAACRLGLPHRRVESIPFGKTWFHDEDGECSRWYQKHVEPSHEHTWMDRTRCRRCGIPGIYGGYSCRIGSPLEGLSSRLQIQIYDHFEDKLEAKRLFIRLGDRLMENGTTWTSLMEWSMPAILALGTLVEGPAASPKP